MNKTPDKLLNIQYMSKHKADADTFCTHIKPWIDIAEKNITVIIPRYQIFG